MQDETLHKLQERVKELAALHQTARILQDESRSPRDVVCEIVKLLPAAWQYPEITEARIRFRDLEEATDGFRIAPWMQTSSFRPRDGMEGILEVVYTEERPLESEGPFLSEERDLIDSLADMLGSYFQHRLADEEIQTTNKTLEELVQTRTAALQKEVQQHREARLQIEEYQGRLRQFATELTLADARERREIAVDLHDHIIQEFAFIKMRIMQFRGDAIFCGFDRNLEEIVSLLEEAIQHARELTFEISTPILYELGLPAALEWLVERFEARHNLQIELRVKERPPSLPEAVRVTLFKCVQELLTNVVKYAKAKRALVTLRSEKDRNVIEVSDDGIGFDVGALETPNAAKHGFGLFSIRERLRYLGGVMDLQSEIGKGTTVRLSVPRKM